MVKEISYTSIRRVLDSIMDHPMLNDVTLEQAVRYTLRFIGLFGFSKMYEDKEEEIEIHQYRGLLPCDLVSITQVKECRTGVCMRAMTDSFLPNERRFKNELQGMAGTGLAFKTQGRVIYTTFPDGKVTVAYKAIPVDEEGLPMLMDNETYLAALEAYIKKQVFTVKFDQGKIQAGVLQNAQRDYAMLAGELQSELTLPSLSEMEAISRSITHAISRVHEFDKGFKSLGNREELRIH